MHAPDDNLADGAAALASRGFFDEDNAPPWDTWLWYAFDHQQDEESQARLREAAGRGY